MTKDFINNHRGLVFLLVGVGILGFFLPKAYDMIIEEKDLQITELKAEIKTTKSALQVVSSYANRLEKKVKTFKIVKPDGTIVERTSSDTVSETKVREEIKQEYEERIQKEKNLFVEEYKKTESSRKKLRIGIGYSIDMQPWGMISYNVMGPFTVHGGLKGGSILFGIGVEL